MKLLYYSLQPNPKAQCVLLSFSHFLKKKLNYIFLRFVLECFFKDLKYSTLYNINSDMENNKGI